MIASRLNAFLVALSLVVVAGTATGCKDPEPNKKKEVSKVTEIVLTPAEVNITVGETLQMGAQLTPKDASNVGDLVWSVRNPNIASISPSGVLKGKEKGETEVICTVGEVIKKAKVTVNAKELPQAITAKLKSNKDLKVVFDVTVSNKDVYVVCDVMSKEIFYGDKVKGPDGLNKNDRAWWEFASGSSDPAKWKNFWFKGSFEFDSSSEESGSGLAILPWDMDYVFYAYEVNEKGEQISDIYIQEFHTPKPVPSNTTFKIDIRSASKENGIDATITPSNNAPYFFIIEGGSTWDQWIANGGYDGLYKNNWEHSLMYVYVSRNKKDFPFLFKTGELVIDKNTQTLPDQHNLRKGREYRMIVFGWNPEYGPTTPIASAPFTVQ